MEEENSGKTGLLLNSKRTKEQWTIAEQQLATELSYISNMVLEQISFPEITELCRPALSGILGFRDLHVYQIFCNINKCEETLDEDSSEDTRLRKHTTVHFYFNSRILTRAEIPDAPYNKVTVGTYWLGSVAFDTIWLMNGSVSTNSLRYYASHPSYLNQLQRRLNWKVRTTFVTKNLNMYVKNINAVDAAILDARS